MTPSYLSVILDRYSVNKLMFSFISGIVRKANFHLFCYVISLPLINIFKFNIVCLNSISMVGRVRKVVFSVDHEFALAPSSLAG